MQTRRERLREATQEEIKAVALKQMGEQGTSGLSLRGVAAEMGMSAPALYNYYGSRDELVTALIVDAYSSLGAALHTAAASGPTEEYGERCLAAVLAYREWALAHRVEYMLIFGSPIPGYHAPPEITVPVTQQAFLPLVMIFQEAERAGKLKIPAEYRQELPPEIVQPLMGWAETYNAGQLSLPALHLTLQGWGLIQGLVTLELYNHLDFLGDFGRFYDFEVKAHLRQLRLLPAVE